MRAWKRFGAMAVAASIGAGLWCGMQQPVQAGQWQVSFEVSGELWANHIHVPIRGMIFNRNTARPERPAEGPDPTRPTYTVTPTGQLAGKLSYNVFADALRGVYSPFPQKYSAWVTVTPILTWISTGPGDVPPDYGVAWVQSSAKVEGTGMGDASAVMEIGDGLETPVPAPTQSPALPPSALDPNLVPSWGKRQVSGGKLVVRGPFLPGGAAGPVNPSVKKLETITTKAHFDTIFPPTKHGGSALLSIDIHVSPNITVSPVPAPQGVALMPCPEPTPSASPTPIPNQYVLTGITPTVIPVGISYQGVSPEGLSYLQQQASWVWKRPSGIWSLPNHPVLYPTSTGDRMTIPNVDPVTQRGWNSQTMYKVSPSYKHPTHLAIPEPGYLFFAPPHSNNHYGEYEVEHLVGGEKVGISPAALFYAADGHNRKPLLSPVGAIGYYDEPNWYHYYKQYFDEVLGGTDSAEYWHTPMRYRSANVPGRAAVWKTLAGIQWLEVDDGAHGGYNVPDPSGSPTDPLNQSNPNYSERLLFGRRDGNQPFVRYVGRQYVRGIDQFYGVVLHECGHHRLYDLLNLGGATHNGVWLDLSDRDRDPATGLVVGDSIPDYLESRVHLDPTVLDTSGHFTSRIDEGGNEGNLNSQYYYHADEEAFCRMIERELTAPQGEFHDWAHDGINKARTPPNRCWRTIESMDPDDTIPYATLPGTVEERNEYIYQTYFQWDDALAELRSLDGVGN